MFFPYQKITRGFGLTFATGCGTGERSGLVAGERGIRESLVTLGAAVAKFKRRLIEGH